MDRVFPHHKKSLLERFRGDLPEEHTYEWDDVTYMGAAGTIRIYGGKNLTLNLVMGCVQTFIMAVGITLLLLGAWSGLAPLLIGTFGAVYAWRTYLRNKARVNRAEATQAKLAVKRASGQGKWGQDIPVIGGDVFYDPNNIADMEAAADRARKFTVMSLKDLRALARMYGIPGRSSMNKEDLAAELAVRKDAPTTVIYEPEFDTTSNEIGEHHT